MPGCGDCRSTRSGLRDSWSGACSGPEPDAVSRLCVEGDLLVGGRHRPRHLQAPLLAEDEPHLARRAKALGVVRPVGRTRPGLGDRAEQVLAEVTALAARLCWRLCHVPSSPVRLVYVK